MCSLWEKREQFVIVKIYVVSKSNELYEAIKFFNFMNQKVSFRLEMSKNLIVTETLQELEFLENISNSLWQIQIGLC